MSLVTNVVRRGGSYYFRVRVPQSLKTKVRRRELWKSLRTLDPSTARPRAGRMMALTEALWSALDRAMSVQAIDGLIGEWLNANLNEDAAARVGLSRRRYPYAVVKGSPFEPEFVRGVEPSEIPEPVYDANGVSPMFSPELAEGERLVSDVSRTFAHDEKQWFRLSGAEDALRRQDIGLVEAEVSALLTKAEIVLDPEGDEFFDACMMMLEARAQLARDVIHRIQTGWRPGSSNGGKVAPIKTQPVSTTNIRLGVSLLEGSKQFVPHVGRTESLKPKRLRDYEKAIGAFVDWLGEDRDLADVTPEEAGAFMNALCHYPANGAKRPIYRDLDFRGRVERSLATNEVAVLDAVTIAGKYLTPVRRMFEWYRKSGHSASIPRNPFDGIAPSKPRRKAASEKRRSFSDNEIRSWLSQPLFVGSEALSQAGLYRSGTMRHSDWHYWLPVISLFTGCRPGEVLGLSLDDIKVEAGIHYFSVRDLRDEQSIKTGEWRRVPIHESLLALGLLTMVESRRKRGLERLFDLEPGAGGYLSDKPSKFFNRMIPKITDPNTDRPGNLVLYSTRHTVISKLREADVRQDVSKEIVGHEDGDVHAGYGEHSLARLKDAINKVIYDGLDLERLRLPTEVLEGKRPY
jgi:integrase